jgi:hypothetical protein
MTPGNGAWARGSIYFTQNPMLDRAKEMTRVTNRGFPSAMSQNEDIDGPIRQHSGWLIPLGVFVVTAGLSALFLLYYLAPVPPSFVKEQSSPTTATDIVNLRVNGYELRVPANYLLYRSARQGGESKEVALISVFPDFRGYDGSDAGDVADNAPDSSIIYLLVRDDAMDLPEKERFDRIYLNYVVNQQGTPGPFGLTQYAFREDSGYRGEDLFVGQTPAGPVVLRCVKLSDRVPSPSCLRDYPVSKTAAISYRFKRTHLSDWRAINDGVNALLRQFHGGKKAAAQER